MGLVSFDSLYSDDTYQHIINCNSNRIGDKTMIPHDFKDYRNKKEPPTLTFMDYFVIMSTSIILTTSYFLGDIITMSLGVIGWRMYETARVKGEN